LRLKISQKLDSAHETYSKAISVVKALCSIYPYAYKKKGVPSNEMG